MANEMVMIPKSKYERLIKGSDDTPKEYFAYGTSEGPPGTRSSEVKTSKPSSTVMDSHAKQAQLKTEEFKDSKPAKLPVKQAQLKMEVFKEPKRAKLPAKRRKIKPSRTMEIKSKRPKQHNKHWISI